MSLQRLLSEYTRQTISSGNSGYIVRPVPHENLKIAGDKRENRVRHVLHIGPEAYQTLHTGDNLFLCKGYDLEGNTEWEEFIVTKIEPSSDSRPPRHFFGAFGGTS